MLYNIRHEISYSYSKPVFLEPHAFHLRPRDDGYQFVHKINVDINPKPSIDAWTLDAFGNTTYKAWFRDKWEKLEVKVSTLVETGRTNPFDFLEHPDYCELPATYPNEISKHLLPYIKGNPLPVTADILQYSERIAMQSGSRATAFLSLLCHDIFSNYKKIHRPVGDAWPADATLKKKEGSCRDLTVLFMECCRAMRLAARFVSGYYEGDHENPENELHAWAEVYVEGGGWRGYDPTSGLAVQDSYVPLAAASIPALVTPSAGSFRGTGARAEMHASVRMSRADDPSSREKAVR